MANHRMRSAAEVVVSVLARSAIAHRNVITRADADAAVAGNDEGINFGQNDITKIDAIRAKAAHRAVVDADVTVITGDDDAAL